jgi:hypothetical protein
VGDDREEAEDFIGFINFAFEECEKQGVKINIDEYWKKCFSQYSLMWGDEK